MPAITRTLPEPDRHRSATIVFDRWHVEKPDAQAETADAILDEWAGRELPADFDSITCFTSLRGDTVLAYQQWSGPSPLKHRQPSRNPVNGSHWQTGTRAFRHFRSFSHQDRTDPTCLVLVTFDFASVEKALQWLELLSSAVAPAEAPVQGCISRHLFLGTDGLTVLNYSEWEAEEDHRKSIDLPPATSAWQRLEGFEGITHGPGARCRLHGTVTNAAALNHS